MLSEPLDLTIIYEPNTKMNYVPDYPGIPTTHTIYLYISWKMGKLSGKNQGICFTKLSGHPDTRNGTKTP